MGNALTDRQYRLGVRLALVAGAVVRAVYLWQIHGNPFFDHPVGDASHFDRWAMAIASGDVAGNGPFFRAPLYPYLLGLVYSIVGRDFLWVRVVQHGIGLAGIWATASLAREFWDRRTGLLAAWLIALYPTTIFFEGELLLDFLLVTLTPLMLIATRRASLSDKTGTLLLCGVLIGACAITRPTVLATVPVLLAWVAWGHLQRHGRLKALRGATMVVLGLLAVTTPVSLRNVMVGNDTVLISSQGGVNFYIGNNPDADGVSAKLPPWGSTWSQSDARTAAEQAERRPLKPSGVSRYWWEQGWQFWRDSPTDALRLFARKFLIFWQDAEFANNQSIGWFTSRWGPILTLIPLSFGVIVAFGVLGGVVTMRRQTERIWLLAWSLAYAVTVIMFFVVARFRLPILPVWTALAAAALIWVWTQIRTRRWKFALLGLTVVIVVFSLTRMERYHVGTRSTARSYLTLANFQFRDGNPARARHFLDSALSIYPGLQGLWLSRGTSFYREGIADSAESNYNEELRHHPGNPWVHANLAQVALDRGDTNGAFAGLERALALQPGNRPVASLKAVLLRTRKRSDLALETLLGAGVTRHGSARMKLLYGVVLLDLGRLDAAEVALREYLDVGSKSQRIASTPDEDHLVAPRDPVSDRALAHYNLGVIAGYGRRWTTATAELSQAVNHDPTLGAAWSNLSTAWLQLQQPDSAIRCAQEAVALQPASPVYLFTEALAHLAAGDSTASRESLQLSLSADSTFPPAVELSKLLLPVSSDHRR